MEEEWSRVQSTKDRVNRTAASTLHYFLMILMFSALFQQLSAFLTENDPKSAIIILPFVLLWGFGLLVPWTRLVGARLPSKPHENTQSSWLQYASFNFILHDPGQSWERATFGYKPQLCWPWPYARGVRSPQRHFCPRVSSNNSLVTCLPVCHWLIVALIWLGIQLSSLRPNQWYTFWMRRRKGGGSGTEGRNEKDTWTPMNRWPVCFCEFKFAKGFLKRVSVSQW